MKVLLTADLRGTGKRGEVIEVKEGYGRNFLLPRGLALPATGANLKGLDQVVKSILKKKDRDLKVAGEMKTRLEEITLTIKKKVGTEGKLFGSVTPKDVSDAIQQSIGVEIDKKLVRMGDPIKMTGAYTVTIHLEQGVNADVKVEVEQEE
jgi:large subunit ribosomal protein L9